MSQDDVDFQDLMGDVTPLSRGRNKADLSRQRPNTPSEAQLARRENALASEDDNFLSDDFVELVGPYDPLEYRRDGIQTGVLERLRHGGYAPEARLHLLKRPLAECRRELFPFIREAHEHELRCVLVVHGRGREVDSPPNVLRSYLAKWLCQFDEVQAYASAQPAHGGLGATYVMLKKSERARARNRERQQKRRG
ncbi:DNA endonuclease SmrA [Litchfieldella qijiaojingensis]|uniref:DNA endonuclease SmrA n=1 Tax=Litchfieldella qijiaojingensis TaxID=980347 RepID=A0ABQ2YDL2_9GAMM|nr:DNA endonuclease SmrA [Halomonas qijiaojingensis]GGX78885.1 DNA endonuclease SmrA [Halomonas qijiaojingensis]